MLRRILCFLTILLISGNALSIPATRFTAEQVKLELENLETREIVYEAMTRALSAKVVNIRTIIIAPVSGGDVDKGVDLGLQSFYARQFEALGYYVISPVVSNAFFRDQGLSKGSDVASIPVNDILLKTGAQAVFYIEAKKASIENSIIAGNHFALDYKGKLVTFGALVLTNIQVQGSLRLTTGIIDNISSESSTEAVIVASIITAIKNIAHATKTDDAPDVLLTNLMLRDDDYFQLPTQAMFGVALGNRPLTAIGICRVSSPVYFNNQNDREGYYPLTYNKVCRNLGDKPKYDIYQPAFWGLDKFPEEVTSRVAKYRSYLQKIGAIR
ncbi:hypothetical protein CKF54_07820 [Psittacicella hinzii]|uniref:Uncharacterized protein n=1 Tax=Psittacicella hinzii TaxID=2028575 RepID=A0A3A1Y1A8_9GAMM|nr:GNA1162 family protein [Psittacicella hinzii]RIY31066.1 hypothetical protein CKF54_07820 [Psittacicella hinzii]